MRYNVIRMLLLSAAVVYAAAAPAGRQAVRRAGPPPPDRVSLTAPVVSLPLVPDTARPQIHVTINGKGPYAFIFDTGASGTVITQALFEELGLPAIGRAGMGSPAGGPPIPATITKVDLLEAGGVRIEGLTVLAADFSHVWGADGPSGVLSPGALVGMLVTFDNPKQQIRVEAGSLPSADGLTIFEWDAADRLPTVPVTIGGREIKAHVDSGAPAGLKLPNSWASTLPLEGGLEEMKPARLVDVEIAQRRGRLRDVPRVGSLALPRDVIFQDGTPAANIGVDVLRNLVVTLDMGARRVRIK